MSKYLTSRGLQCAACIKGNAAIEEFINNYRAGLAPGEEDHLPGNLMAVAVEEVINDPEMGAGDPKRVLEIVAAFLQRYAIAMAMEVQRNRGFVLPKASGE